MLFISRHDAYGSAMQPSERTSNQTSADTVFRPAPIDTHTVLNQPPPLVDYDVYGCDTALTQATAVFGLALPDE